MNNVMIGAVKKPTKRQYIAYYYEGVKEPDFFEVKSMELSDPKFSIRDLFVELNSGDKIRINKENITEFKAGKTVILKSSKGNYAVKLLKRK